MIFVVVVHVLLHSQAIVQWILPNTLVDLLSYKAESQLKIATIKQRSRGQLALAAPADLVYSILQEWRLAMPAPETANNKIIS